jgi:hypothetical protein
MQDQAGGGVLVEGESSLAVRLTKDLRIEGKRETNFLPINPQKAEVKLFILQKKAVLKVAHITDQDLILWTDRSRLEDGRVRCVLIWKEEEERWEVEWHYLEKKNEIFDIKVYTIQRGLLNVAAMLPTTGDSKLVIFSD